MMCCSIKQTRIVKIDNKYSAAKIVLKFIFDLKCLNICV